MTSVCLVIQDGFDFVLFFVIDDIRWWVHVIRTMYVVFVIRR